MGNEVEVRNWEVEKSAVEEGIRGKKTSVFPPLKNSIERDLKAIEVEKNLAKILEKISFSVFSFSLCFLIVLSSQLSRISFLSIRAWLLLKMSNSYRTRKHTKGRYSFLFIQFRLFYVSSKILRIIKQTNSLSMISYFFCLNLVNFKKNQFLFS